MIPGNLLIGYIYS